MSIRIPGAKIIPGIFDGMCHDYDNGVCTAIYHMCSVCPDRKNKMPEKINDADLLKKILFGDIEGYSMVKEIDEGGSRWHRLISSVFQREHDRKLFIMEWRRGSTENQDHEWPDVAYEAEEYHETRVCYRVLPRPKTAAVPAAPKIITKGL